MTALGSQTQSERIAELRNRMGKLLARRDDVSPARAASAALGTEDAAAKELPLLPGLAELPALRAGAVHQVDNLALALALLAGPARAGDWVAVVGLPELGYLAAEEAGLRLDRTIVIPDPGADWLSVLAELTDLTGLVLTRPAGRLNQSQAERFRARLRRRGSALLSCGGWPRSEANYSLRSSRWVGLGHGAGHLTARRAEIEVRRPGRPVHHCPVWLPGADLSITPAGELRPEQPTEATVHPLREAG
ncbi:hypothetical protein CGZ94_07655 [Enemella evansiae]|uniref:Protein ImuA n=1 Tax=Enemella evansiae TaxID=2016499 RepID=A0A255GN95_9ACTN|nr:hypothetical protein [Enemella evansiae]OYO07562.1 hypothetical protein CGZ98_19185 [Enemella evansiae]OYO14464.1 hypothetical protein CGZ94_07655 [Enemella evansiae]